MMQNEAELLELKHLNGTTEQILAAMPGKKTKGQWELFRTVGEILSAGASIAGIAALVFQILGI
jgi:hypothetical protein